MRSSSSSYSFSWHISWFFFSFCLNGNLLSPAPGLRNEIDTAKRIGHKTNTKYIHNTGTRKCVHLGNGIKVVALRSTAIAVVVIINGSRQRHWHHHTTAINRLRNRIASQFKFSQFSVNGANAHRHVIFSSEFLFRRNETVCLPYTQTFSVHLQTTTSNKQIRINLTNKIYITLYVSTFDSFKSLALEPQLELVSICVMDCHTFAITIVFSLSMSVCVCVLFAVCSYCVSRRIK